MVGKGLIGTIILIVISLFVFGAVAGDALMAINNSATLTANGVPASTVAIYGLVGLIAIVGVVMLYLKIGTGGR